MPSTALCGQELWFFPPSLQFFSFFHRNRLLTDCRSFSILNRVLMWWVFVLPLLGGGFRLSYFPPSRFFFFFSFPLAVLSIEFPAFLDGKELFHLGSFSYARCSPVLFFFFFFFVVFFFLVCGCGVVCLCGVFFFVWFFVCWGVFGFWFGWFGLFFFLFFWGCFFFFFFGFFFFFLVVLFWSAHHHDHYIAFFSPLLIPFLASRPVHEDSMHFLESRGALREIFVIACRPVSVTVGCCDPLAFLGHFSPRVFFHKTLFLKGFFASFRLKFRYGCFLWACPVRVL